MLLVFFAALLALSAAAKLPGSRIVNGEYTEPGEVPWQVSLQLDGSHICGAVAITDHLVLTAAHCVDFSYEPSRFSFVCGLHDIVNDPGQRAYAQDIIMHEAYDSSAMGFPNDIAIVWVDPPFKFDEYCQNANLPPHNEKDYADKHSTISGWGRLRGEGPMPDILKKAHIPTITNAVCGIDYNWLIFTVIRASHICVKDPSAVQGACNGDSGGPLTTRDFDTGRMKVVGITSFGKVGCDTTVASVYTRVSYYIDWINERSRQLLARRG